MNISGEILIIDDDHDDHEVFKEICDNFGVCDNLKFFDNGFKLIDHLKASAKPPFIILCDINMPHINGLELRKLINEDPILKPKSIPFIFFSTAASTGQVRQAYDLTVQGFFLKGQTMSETQSRFKKILDYWSECKHP